MSASTGSSSKGEKGKSKYQSLDINSIYNNTRSEASEAQATKSTVPRKHGMQTLGKVPQRRPPANLPSLKSENSGNDPSISLVPTGGTGWVKSGESQQLTPSGGSSTTGSQNNLTVTTHQSQTGTSTASPAPVAGTAPAPILPSAPPTSQTSSQDKTWSAVTGGGTQAPSQGSEHGPSFLAHQSPLFRQEFPSLSGEPGGAPAHPTPSYGPGPSLRPQTEPGSWSQGTARPQPSSQTNHNSIPFKSVVPSFLMSQGSGIPMFPESIQKRSRSQANHENRINRMPPGGQNALRPAMGAGANQSSNTGDSEDHVQSRPIIREEELVKLEEVAGDDSWAANDDIDYNEDLFFSDRDSVGEDEKENKLKDKSNKQQALIREEKKEDIDKTNRDKPFMSERDRNQQLWRVANSYSDYRNTPPRQLVPNSRLDDDELWKEKRRQTTEHKMAVAEKAKQRKEEEMKRPEESRAKKSNKDISDYHMTSSSSFHEFDKDIKAKYTETFKQITQFPLEGRQNLNRERDRERDMRSGRDQFSNRNQNKPPRFRQQKDQAKMQPFGGGGGGGFEKNWSNHNSFGRRGPDSVDKEDDFRKDRDRHERPSPSDSGPDRCRLNMREERNVDLNKRNFYDNSHMDYNQSSFQSNREADKEKESIKDYDYRMSEKESSGRDNDKNWESSKGETEMRNFDDRIRRDKPLNENFPKQTNEHFEEKENEWRGGLQRPSDNRDRADRMDRVERIDRDSRPDSRDHRLDNRDNRMERDNNNRDRTDRMDSRPDIRLDRQDSRDSRGDSRLDSRDNHHRDYNRLDNREYSLRHDNRSDNRDIRLDGRDNRHDNRDNRAEMQDIRSDRPSRPDSRDSRASRDSRNSKDSSDKPFLLDGDYPLPDNSMEKMGLPFKEKDMRREPVQRVREYVPGPITPEKVVAHEHKQHNQSQMEKCETQDKDDDKKLKKLLETDHVSQAWGESREDKPLLIQESPTTSQEPPRTDFLSEDCKVSNNKIDDNDKRKDNGGGMRDRRDDNKSMNSGGSSGRGNRPRGGSRNSGYPTGNNKYMNPGSNWQNKDSSPKFQVWKSEKERRDDKKDMKIGGSDSDKERIKGDKKQQGGGHIGDGGRKGGDSGFAPRPTGEPSRRGRGGGGMRGGMSRLGPVSALYGPPGSKPFSSSSGSNQSNPPPLNLESQDKQFSPPQQSGRKDDGQGGKGRDGDKGLRGKGMRSQDDPWETASETSDGSDVKKSNKNRNKSDKKSRGTIGDKRSLLNMNSAHLNGRPDTKPDDSGNEKKSNKDDSDPNAFSSNGFQEVKSKKTGREGRGGPGGIKEEVKRSRSKGKEKTGGGVKSQQKSYSREFVNNKPPRMQRLDNSRKQQQQQAPQHDVSELNKINQSVSSLFPISRSNDVSNSCPPPPAHNAWNKPINIRTTPPLSTTLTQLTAAPAQITTDKTNIEDLGQTGNPAQANSPTADKAITKLSREVVEKSILEGPPVNTIIFENTNYKRDPGDIGMKPRYAPIKGPTRTPMEKTRERKIEDELVDGNHAMSLGGFKATELQSPDGKPQDNIQVPISFGKNEDNADMKLDFAFDSDLSQLSDDKTNQSMHVGQSSAADLNQKIASVKKVWDTPPAMSGHVDEGATSSFTQGFVTDKSMDPTAPSHHSDHTDFNTTDSVYGNQLSGGGAYVATGSSMMKPDAIVSGTNTMCKTNMFQVSPQPQPVTVMPHPGPLSTPPPIPNVLSFQPGYSSNLSVPSPPNVLYNSQQAAGPQTEIYQTYSLSTPQMHGSGNRSYADFPPPYNNMSQNSTFQPSMFMQSAPPTPQSVFQNPTPYRLPHGSAAALSQQMNSNPSTMLMSSSSNSVVSGSQVKSTQGSLQPTAIGGKTGGGPPTAYSPHSAQILLIEPPPTVGFLHQSYHRPATIQHSSSFFPTNSTLAPGGSTGGLFNSASLLSSGGGGATTGSLPSGSPFGVQPGAAASYNQQPPSSTQPPSHPAYPNQPQMGANFRSQTGYPKTGQHPSDSAKSSSQDQFQSMFQSNVQGSPKPPRVSVKPQPSASSQPPHKFPFGTNPHSVSQSNLGYQQSGGNNGGSRQGQGGQQVGMRTAASVASVVPSQPRYISPIQRPMGPSYSQQQAVNMMQQQARQQQQHRMQQQSAGRAPTSAQQSQSKQYYQQQGGGMKMEGNDSVKNDVEDQNKASQDKSSKDEQSADQ